MKPLGKVEINWSSSFAYAIGLLVTDGNLSSDGRHVIFTSKDLELINKFQKSLKINLHIGKKSSGSNKNKDYYVIQIGDILFYRFLTEIGLMRKKTKIIGTVSIPEIYFFDFLRGHFDGDGCFYSYWDPRWKSSFMFYTTFVSSSKKHIDWLREKILNLANIKGHTTKSVSNSVYQLKYAKTESLKLLPKMYYDEKVICLTRKRIKIEKAIKINKRAGGVTVATQA